MYHFFNRSGSVLPSSRLFSTGLSISISSITKADDQLTRRTSEPHDAARHGGGRPPQYEEKRPHRFMLEAVRTSIVGTGDQAHQGIEGGKRGAERPHSLAADHWTSGGLHPTCARRAGGRGAGRRRASG